MEHIGYIIGKNIQLPNYLGMLVEGEDLTEYITLKMKKDETLEGLNYYLTYKNADGAGDTFALTKEITDKEILLSFVVTNAFTAVKGKMEIQVTGYELSDDPAEDDPVWKSFVCTISIARALHPEEIQPDTPTIFVQYLTQMQELKEAAETAQGKAEDAQEAAETAQGKAEDAQDAAEDAQDAAEDAQAAAETAQGKAETAQGKAEQAQSASESAKDTSVANANLSSQYARGKKLNGTDVVSGEDGYHDNSKYYKGLAETANTNAQSAKTSAENARDKAEKWAEESEDTPVETGKYSAKHYASKASASATSASSSASSSEDSAEDSEAWATGKRGDTDVGSTDPTYHNNSKYYSGLAQTAKTNAETAQGLAEDARDAAQGYATDADNARIATVSETTSPDDGGTNTITITYKDGTVKTFSVTNGHTGAPFAIYKTYASIAAMNADFANVPEGKFVIIASNTEDPDNAKLYVRGSSAFTFITDLSGAQGIQGPDGLAATIAVGTVTTGQAGSSATVTNTGTSSAAVFDFVIPKGDKGDTGSTGATGKGISSIAYKYAVTTTQSAPSAESITSDSIPTMSATNKYLWQKQTISYTSGSPTVNIALIAVYGDKGDTGSTGSAATVSVGTTTTGQAGTNASVTNSGTSSAAVLNFTIPKGDKGDTGSSGAAATISVGTVQTGAAGSSATVTNSGTSSAAVFDFSIPKGDKGDTGATGADGADGEGVPTGGTTGQILRKKSSTNFDTEWVDDDAYRKPSGGIPSTDMSSAVQTSLGKADTALQAHQDISGKADKSEMSVSTSGDKTTITLKSGTSAQVLNAHQDISGKADKVSGATTGNLAKLDSNGNLADSGIDSTKVLTESDVKDNTTTQSATKPLSANMGYSLQQEVNTLKARGRFLSLWDCITGLPVSFPLSVPYAYMSGDYFVVSNSVSYIKDNTNEYDDTADYAVNVYTVYQDVLYKCNTAIVGGEAWNPAHWDAVTNDYIPTGSSYAGTASSVVATEEIFVNDTYIYDGTYWLHQINTGGKVAFQNIAGNPDDNLALASKFANVVKHDSDIPGSATPINADQLNGHTDDYFGKAGNLAVVETSPATAAHSVGELIVYNGTLYKVVSAIAIGDTLTVGSNISGQTVANALSDISEYSTGSVSIESSYYNNSQSQLFKIGRTVYCSIQLIGSTAISGSFLHVTIPTGFRPSSSTKAMVGDLFNPSREFYPFSEYFYVNSDGKVHQNYSTGVDSDSRIGLLFIYQN